MQKMNINVQEVLENYNTYKARISITEAEIEELENEIVDIRSASLDGMPKAKGFVESNIENQVIERQSKIGDKQRYIKNLRLKIKVIEDLVKTLKKYNQDIIEMRYYQMISIEEIAVKKERTRGAISKMIDKSIGKMQREYNKSKKSI